MCNEAVACILPYKLGLVPDDYFKALMKQRIEISNGITYYRLCMMFFVPDCFKTEEVCNKAVCMDPYGLEFIPGHLKMQEMCDEALHREPYTLRYVPDHLKTQEMYNKVVGKDPCSLEFFSDRFKVEDICIETVLREPYTLRYVHGPCLLMFLIILRHRRRTAMLLKKLFDHLMC